MLGEEGYMLCGSWACHPGVYSSSFDQIKTVSKFPNVLNTTSFKDRLLYFLLPEEQSTKKECKRKYEDFHSLGAKIKQGGWESEEYTQLISGLKDTCSLEGKL